MRNESLRSAAEVNLIWAVAGILAVCCGCALFTALVIQDVQQTLASSNSMVVLIGADSFASDDKNLEHSLNSAKATLDLACDISCAVVATCVMIAGALVWRLTAWTKRGY
jgi:hypothetical protein